MSMIEVFPFFAIPFGMARLADCQELNGQLRELFLKRASMGARHANPRPLTQRSRQVFESEFQLFAWQEPSVQKLKEYCWHQLMKMVGELNGYDPQALGNILINSESWFHVTRRGGFFALHNHPNASFSGVYCVDPGRSDPGNPQSGLLSFMNPAVASAMYMDAATLNLRGAYGYNIRHIALEPGQLVIFPSWILHDVKPFEGEGDRITVAFNCWFEFNGEPPPRREYLI
jgi:uncharacterized protein (TIGR02466 family)